VPAARVFFYFFLLFSTSCSSAQKIAWGSAGLL